MKERTPITPVYIESADRIAFLITGYIRSILSDEEKDELDNWITSNDANVELFAQLTDPARLDDSLKTYNSFNSNKALSVIKAQLISEKLPQSGKLKMMRWLPYTVAASLALILTLYVITKINTPSKDPSFKSLADVKPGTNKAILTLADGRTILLDSINEKSLQAAQLGFSQNNGRLVYSPSANEGGQGNLKYHTLSIPRGGQYQLSLPDGSTVWLNAESSIRFPSSF
ncbi:MAG: FecR domain-containing protein, partial [Chitinophagaceae bacterium]|nr:FecR domain-containing protein [Chitinophagaceae bacterium]